MGTISGKITAILVALFLITYVGYQIYRGFSNPVKTEAALLYTVQDVKRVKGIIVRNEVVMPQTGAGVVAYFNDDSVKVTYGTPVAEVYASKEDVTNKRRIKTLEAELVQLEGIQKPGNSYFLNSGAITKQISENLYEIIKQNQSRELVDIAEKKAELLLNLNKKQLATGAVSDFSNKVDKIQNEKASLENSTVAATQVITADEVGYFSSYVDGAEQQLTPQNLENFTLDQIQEYIDKKYSADETALGKLVRQEPWYFATPIPKEETMFLYEGMKLEINFGVADCRNIPAEISSIKSEDGSDTDIVILSCDYMGSQLTRLRNPSVQLNFEEYTGIKIPNQAVRFKNNERGVYVVVGEEVVFKPIDVIYEGANYVLSNVAVGYVQQYDEIVVKGIVTEAEPKVSSQSSGSSSSEEQGGGPSDASSSGG